MTIWFIGKLNCVSATEADNSYLKYKKKRKEKHIMEKHRGIGFKQRL